MSISYEKHYRSTSATNSNKHQTAAGTAVPTTVTTTRATETEITSQHMTDIFSQEHNINHHIRKGGLYNDDDEVAPTQVWLDSRKAEQRNYLDTTRGELLSIVKHRGEILDDTVLRNLIKLQYNESVERLAKVEIREQEKREEVFRYFLDASEQGASFKEIIQAKHNATLVPWCTNGCKYCCMYRPDWDTHVRVTTTWNGALLEDAETRAREGLTGEMIGQFNALISYAGATQLQLQLMEGHTATLYAEEQATRSKFIMMEQVYFYQQFTVRHAEKLQKWESKQYAQELRDKTLESHRDLQKLQLMHVKAFRQMNLLCTSEESSKRDAMEQIQESKFQDLINKFSYRYTEIKAQQWRTEVKVALEERDSLLKFQEETIAKRSKDYEEAQKKQQNELEREFRELRKIRKAGAGDVSPPCPRCGQIPARDMTSHRLNECTERPTQCTKCATIIPMSQNDSHRDECPSRVLKCQHCSNYFKASYLHKVHDESRCRRVQIAIQKLKHAKPHLPLSVVPSGDVGTLLQAVRCIELVQLAFVSNLVRSTFFGGKAGRSLTSRTMLESASGTNITAHLPTHGISGNGDDGGNGSELGAVVDQSSIIDVEQLAVGLVESPRGTPRNSQDTLCAANGSLSTEESVNNLLNSSSAVVVRPHIISNTSSSMIGDIAVGGGGFNTASSPSRKHLSTASSHGGGGVHNTVARHTNALSSGAQAVVGRYSHALALPAALALFNELRTQTSHKGDLKNHPIVSKTSPVTTELQLNSNNLVTRTPSVQIFSPQDGDGASRAGGGGSAGLTTLGMAAVAPHVGVHIPVTANQALQQQILRVLTAFQNPHTVEAVHQVFMSLPRWVPPSGLAFVDSVLTETGPSPQIYKPVVTSASVLELGGASPSATTTPPTHPEDLNISTMTNSEMGSSIRLHLPHQQSNAFSPSSTVFSKINVEGISGVPMRMPAHIQPFDPAMNSRRHLNIKTAESASSSKPASPGAAPKRHSSVFENRRGSGVANTATVALDSTSDPVVSVGSSLPSAKPRVHLLSAPFQPCRGYVLSGGLQALATSIGEKGGPRSRPGSSAVNRVSSETPHRVVSGLVLDAAGANNNPNNAPGNNLATFTSKNQCGGRNNSIDATQVSSRPATGAAPAITSLPETAMNAVYLTPPGTTSFVTTTPGVGAQNGVPTPAGSTTIDGITTATYNGSGGPSSGQWVSVVEFAPVRPSYHPLYPPFLPLPPKEGSVVFITHVNDVPVGKFIIKHVRGFTAHLQHQHDIKTGNTHHNHSNHHHRNSSTGSPHVASRTKRSDSHSVAKSDDFDSQSQNEGSSFIQPIHNATTTAMAPVVEVLEQAYRLLVETEGLPSLEELLTRYSDHCRGDALCDMLASLLQPMITHYVDQQGINGIGQEVRIRVVATAAASYQQEVGFNAVNTVYRRRFQDHFPEGNAIDLFAAQQTVEQLLQNNSARGGGRDDDSETGQDHQTPSDLNGVLVAYPPALAFELQYVIGCSETSSVEEYESLKFLMVSDTSQYCKPGAGQISSNSAPKKEPRKEDKNAKMRK